MADFKNTYTISAPFLGLQNIGATCYMNSVLQALFMTPEFRRGLFLWSYDEQVHGNEKDSIPFQLQRLFGRMQTKVFEYIEPRDLIKSFQWDYHQAFEQHDIQEFIRVLFDAYEQNLVDGQANFLKEVYEGLNVNYTKCLKCGYESQRQEPFLDYSVVVKNKWGEKQYNDNLLKAIQLSLKPETLSGQNQYFCEMCQTKVDAQRGSRIVRCPSIFTLYINRFTFDYMQMKREKLDDYMTFPFVLNMNHYLNGYDGIPNKVSEECDEKYFQEQKPRPVQKKFQPTPNAPPPPAPPPVTAAMKKQTKSTGSSQTKDFISQMRKQNKKGKKDDIDIEIQIGGSNFADDETQRAIEESLKGSVSENKPQVDQTVPKQDQGESSSCPPPPPPPPPPQPPATSQPNENKQQNVSTSESAPVGKPEGSQQREPVDYNVEEDRQKYFAYVDKRSQEHNEECDRQIRECLKDGEHVYQLFSLLIHSGGAMGGHYYAFVKAYDSGKWYCFNDSNVTGLDPNDIGKRAFGGTGSNCAYMLFYRKVDQGSETFQKWGGQFTENDLPQVIQDRIAEERKKLQEYLEQGVTAEDLAMGVRQLTIKVHYKLEVKLLHVQSTDLFSALQDAAFEAYGIKDRKNCRLRGYVPHTDTLTDSYSGKEGMSLQALKIQCYKNMGFEFKEADDQWTHYDSSILNVRYTLWEPGLGSLEEKNLKIFKVQAKKNMTVAEFEALLKEKSGLTSMTIIKYHMDYGIEYAEIINSKESKVANLEQMPENQLFFIEEEAPYNEQGKLDSKWAKEFDNELHRISIKYNNPKAAEDQQPEKEGMPNEEFPHSIAIDSRQPMSELKRQICQAIGLDVGEVILRRGGRAGLELKDMAIEIGLNHFVKGSSIYVELGCPLNPGEYRCLVSIAHQGDPFDDRNFYNFQEIGEYAVPGDKNLNTFKDAFVSWVGSKIGAEIDPSKARLRERIGERLTKVYRDRPLKEQGILEKRMISLEVCDSVQSFTQKELLIIVRFWDQEKWELSERCELVVSKSASGVEFGEQIASAFQNLKLSIESLQACRIVALHRFNRFDLISEEWHPLNSVDIMLASQPLFITNDGQLIIIRDASQQPRELTEDEAKKFGVIRSQQAQKHPAVKGKGFMPTVYHKEEKALKITVKKKEQKLPEPVEQLTEQPPEQPVGEQSVPLAPPQNANTPLE